MTLRAHGVSESPLTVVLKAGGYSISFPLLEVWVKDAGTATFTVYGSHSGEDGTWKYIGEVKVPHAGRDNRHERYMNAYPFIKVVTESVTLSEVEIIAGEA